MSNMEKLERKYLAHFIDAAFNAESPEYFRLGQDLEEYSIEMNPDGEDKTNIIGEARYDLKGYKPSSNVDPFYAYEGDKLFEHLEEIINERATGAKTQTTVVDVRLNASGEVVSAYREDVIVIPTSYGGDTGIGLPFEIHYNGNRTKGTFDLKTKTFTPVPEVLSTSMEVSNVKTGNTGTGSSKE